MSAVKLAGLFVAVLAMVMAGCSHVIAGNEISLAHIAFIRPGVTSRTEIVENFGRPMWESEDATVIAYFWQTGGNATNTLRRHGITDPERTFVNYRARCFVVRFDGNGRVQNCNFLEAEDSQQLEARLLDWVKRTGPVARATTR